MVKKKVVYVFAVIIEVIERNKMFKLDTLISKILKYLQRCPATASIIAYLKDKYFFMLDPYASQNNIIASSFFPIIRRLSWVVLANVEARQTELTVPEGRNFWL